MCQENEHHYVPVTIAETAGPGDVIRRKMVGFCEKCGDSVAISTLPNESMKLGEVEFKGND